MNNTEHFKTGCLILNKPTFLIIWKISNNYLRRKRKLIQKLSFNAIKQTVGLGDICTARFSFSLTIGFQTKVFSVFFENIKKRLGFVIKKITKPKKERCVVVLVQPGFVLL